MVQKLVMSASQQNLLARRLALHLVAHPERAVLYYYLHIPIRRVIILRD
jgi:hypothetical protein